MRTFSQIVTLGGMVAGLYATAASAQASTTVGDDNDIRFRWGVPEAVASSGSGNVYFQLNASQSYEWVGLGIGSRMAGSEIFLMYQDGDGNVTLSTREASGHSPPSYSSRSAVELLSGSGVSGGRMVANVRCGDCDSLDLEGQNSWIAAWKSGSSMDSTNPREQINIHDGKTVFRVNLAQASISNDENPFLASSGEEDDGGDDTGAVDNEGSSEGNDDAIILAHGIIMTIVFIALYPIGAILMPLFRKWFIHSTSQLIAYLLMWAGFALGYTYANRNGYRDEPHSIIGIIVVALMGFQPVFGWLHHRHFAKHQGRGLISHVHIWYGRILMILGVVNGGLGLRLAGKTDGAWVIAYGVVSGIMAIAYVASIFIGSRRKRAVVPKAEDSGRSS